MVKWIKQLMCQHEFIISRLHGIDNEFMQCNNLITCSKCGKSLRAKSVTDGYHSFDELYDHRSKLFIALMKSMPDKAFWTRKDKGGHETTGYIICGIETAQGQISYHVPVRFIPLVKNITYWETNRGFDGYTSKDVLDRLEHI